MKEIYQNIFNTEFITEEIYIEILEALSKSNHLKKIVPKGIISITEYYNSLIEIKNITEEEILKMPKIGVGKLNKIKAFQSSLKADQDYFINYYCINEVTVSLPFTYNSEDDILVSFSELMKELAAVYDLRGDKKSKRNAEVIKLYYGIEGKITGREEISKKLGVSRQLVDQLITEPNQSVIMQLFASKEPVDRIMVDSAFYMKVQDVKQHSLWNHKFLNKITSEGEPNIELVNRFTESFQCYLTEIEQDYFLVEKSNTNAFREHYRALKQTMNQQIEPLLLNEICDLVAGEIKETKKLKLSPDFIEKLLKQDIYECIITDEETIKYSIQWEMLSSVVSKVKRILFERNQPLLRDEILEEYKDRLLEKGLDVITNENLIMRGDVELISLGNNNWTYSNVNDNLINNRLNTWSFISEYVKTNGGVCNFEEIKNAISQENYNHPDNSIRAYILKSCYVLLSDRNRFIHKEMTGNHPEIKYVKSRKSEVGKEIMEAAISVLSKNNNILNKSTLYQKITEACDKDGIDIGRLQNIDNNIKKLIELDLLYEAEGKFILDADAEEKSKELKYRKEPKYKSTIRSLAINYLKSINNKETTPQELWRISKKYYPENIVKNNFYKIFNDSSIFNKTTVENKQYINLNTNLLPVPKEYTQEVIEPVEEVGQQVSVENIELNTRVKFNIEKLTSQLKKELKSGFNLSELDIDTGIIQFYKALQSNGTFSRWGESLLQSIYELWFTKTDFYDREVCLIKLTTNYETYIKELDPQLKYFSGMAEIIKNNPALNELRWYKDQWKSLEKWKIDYPKRNYSKYMSALIYLRNLYAHDTGHKSLDMGMSNQITNATNFIALYIYSAHLLRNLN